MTLRKLPHIEHYISETVRIVRDIEWVDDKCPWCRYPKPLSRLDGGHSWQCQLAKCLDYWDEILEKYGP